MFYHLAFGCAIRNGVFGVTVGSLGSLVLCREPQAEDTHPVSRPDGAHGGCGAVEHPLQEPFWLPWEGTKQLWQWREPAETDGRAVWGTRLWSPSSLQAQSCPQLPAKEGSAESATTCHRAVFNGLRPSQTEALAG